MEEDAPMDLELAGEPRTLTPEDVDFSFLDPIWELNAASQAASQSESSSSAQRAYHTKRPHKKSRRGCKQCKSRKVKCDEGRPSCRACTLRREKCVYPASAAPQSPAAAPAEYTSSVAGSSVYSPRAQSVSSRFEGSDSTPIVSEPLFRPAAVGDAVDMRMLWFYTAETYNSFSIEGGRSPVIDRVLKVKVVEHAFECPFLMQCILGLSALQLKVLKQEVPREKTVAYQSRAFEGYRAAIEAAKPSEYPALLACSLLMCGLSSQMFREADTKPLYIVDWMIVWRGIGLIVEIVTPQSIKESGLAVLFYRPPIDLEKTALHIPGNLLFMVTSIKPGDPDYEFQQLYYEVLKYLGSLYLELQHGFSPILDLRIITFFTFIPKGFIPLAKEYRPRTLVILAHYLAFAKLNDHIWWMNGIANREIDQISKALSAEWADLLHVPLKVAQLTERAEIGRAIIDNHAWSPSEQDLYEKNRDPRVKSLKLINDAGKETAIENGKWVLKTTSPLLDKMTAVGPSVSDELPGDQTLLGRSGEETGDDPNVAVSPLTGVHLFGVGNPLNPLTPKASAASPHSPAQLTASGV